MKCVLTGSAVCLGMALLAPMPALAAGGKGDAALGEYLSSECVSCHQTSGRVTAGVPSILGWPEEQFVAVMQSYKAKVRDNSTMQAIAGRLSSDDIDALAAYFGGLQAQAAR